MSSRKVPLNLDDLLKSDSPKSKKQINTHSTSSSEQKVNLKKVSDNKHKLDINIKSSNNKSNPSKSSKSKPLFKFFAKKQTQQFKPESTPKTTDTTKNLITFASYKGGAKRTTVDSKPNVKQFNWVIKVFSTLIFIFVLIAIPFISIKAVSGAIGILKSFNISLSFHDVTALVTSEPKLRTDKYGRTNILLVGIDSRGKIGQGLMNTDTIMLLSYDAKKNVLNGVSFPRDLWVKYPGTYYSNKINAVYAYGERKKPGHGIEYLKGLIERLSGTKIQYYAMINFEGFRTLIDKLGGIDVYVERSFVDYSYPKGLGYQTVRFTKGWNHFNGERALQYSRSRKAAGPEGSDFARARRQQKVIQAVIDKIKKQGITDPKVIYDLIKVVADNVILSKITPLDIQAGLEALNKGKPTMHSLVLDPSAGNYTLITRGSGHLYTLVPKAGVDNWSQVQLFIKDWFNAPVLISDNPQIFVYNAGSSDFSAEYKALIKRFFYLKFINGGKLTPKVSGKIITSPSSKYKDDVMWLGKTVSFLKYEEYDAEAMPSKIKDDKVSIMLGVKIQLTDTTPTK